MPTIDVVQALELLEQCAEEMTSEHVAVPPQQRVGRRAAPGLAARALAKRQLTLAHLVRRPPGQLPPVPADRPAPANITLGALIALRTADRMARAGASTAYTLDAVYRAVHRYVASLPSSLQDQADRAAVDALLGGPGLRPPRSPGVARRHGPGTPTGATTRAASEAEAVISTTRRSA